MILFILVIITIVLIALLVALRKLRALPARSTNAAWIGFLGNIIGALLAVLAATLAWFPAYRQMEDTHRSAAVQAGEIIRRRFSAARAEFNDVLLRSDLSEQIPNLLAMDGDSSDRNAWLLAHPDRARQINEVIIPRLHEIGLQLIKASMDTQLPDLDRTRYMFALQDMETDLQSVLDGIPRKPDGETGPPMDAAKWRQHVLATIICSKETLPAGHQDYNQRLDAAMQILRFESQAADKEAIGPENDTYFRASQEMIEKLLRHEKTQ